MKSSQLSWVKEQLKVYGEISRNSCLKAYISRLGAIICVLKAQGYSFETERRDGDYVYKLVDSPKKVVWEYEMVNGEMKPVGRVIPV